MLKPTVLLSVFVAAMFTTMTPAPATAIPFDNQSVLTFSGPVQVPGVTLDAGSYRFRLANADSGRNVIQVLSHDGSSVYAMFHTTPDSRMTATTESTVTFLETPAGVAPAVKSLFYGGELHGYEFVYGKGEPNLMPPLWPQPPITASPLVAEPTTAMAATDLHTPFASEPPAEYASEPAVVEPAPAALPHTASPLPLVAVSGLASILLGLGAGLLRRVRS